MENNYVIKMVLFGRSPKKNLKLFFLCLNAKDESKMELTAAIEKLWDEPGRELLILHNPNEEKIFRDPSFDILLKFLRLELTKDELYYHPVFILSILLSNVKVIRNDNKLIGHTNITRNRLGLKVQKISLNKYQKIFIKDENVEIGLKLPTIVTPETIKRIKFEEVEIKRHPQLRRILRDYFQIHGVQVSMEQLECKLIELNIDSDDYSYFDADELFMYNQKYNIDTYVELLPIELKSLIVNSIDENVYLTLEDLKKNNVHSIIEIFDGLTNTVINKVNDGEDMSMSDIVKNINIDEISKQIKNLNTGNSIKDLFNNIEENYGIGNIISGISEKINAP